MANVKDLDLGKDFESALKKAHWTVENPTAASYVACCFGQEGANPGDVDVAVYSTTIKLVVYQVREVESGDTGDEVYTTLEEANDAAQEWADDRNEATVGEDADDMYRRLLKERQGDPNPNGGWACYWQTALDDEGPRERYETREAAEAAIELKNLEFDDANPGGPYLCGYVLRVLEGDKWVDPDDED